MKKLIERLGNWKEAVNEGYLFVKRDLVYVPFIETCLSVTKRSFFILPLLDEIILRLLNAEVHEIEELVNILGVERKHLEITLADLHVRDFLCCTSDRCTLTRRGRDTLQELRYMERRRESLKNIYLDPVNKKVLEKYDGLQFIDKVHENDKKLDADFSVDNVEVFKENIGVINEIFRDEMSIYNDRTKAEPDELLSIDRIEKAHVKYVKIPVYIYAGSSGDIDILSAARVSEHLLPEFKAEIIAQIRQHKILKRCFTKYAIKDDFSDYSLEMEPVILELIKKYKRAKGDEKETLLAEIETNILQTRRLFDDEFQTLAEYLIREAGKVEIKISCLDDWCRDETLIYVLSMAGKEKLECVKYSYTRDFERSASLLEKTVKGIGRKTIQESHGFYIYLKFGEQYELIGVPENINVIDASTFIHKTRYYLIVSDREEL